MGVTEDEFRGTIRLKKSQRKAVVLAEVNKVPLTLALRGELIRRLYTDEQMIGMSGSQAKKLLKKFHEQL